MKFTCCDAAPAQPKLKAGDVIQLLDNTIEGLSAGDVCLVGRWYTYEDTRLNYLIRLRDGTVKGNLNLDAPNHGVKFRTTGFTCDLKEE